MKKVILSLTLLITLSLFAQAQTQVNFKVNHMLGADAFALNQTAQNNFNQDFNVSNLFYFISGITIIHDGGMQTPVANKYIFVDASAALNEDLGTFSNITSVEGIKFHIGVDSPNNNADPSTFPAGHPLADKAPPMNMNWSWPGGYRFIKINGMAGASLGQNYQLHPLWNRNYFEQTHMTTGFSNGGTVDITLNADYIQALKDINIGAGVIRHGADMEDLDMLKNFRDFVFSPSTSLSTNDFSQALNLNIYPNPSQGQINIEFENDKYDITSAKVINVAGQLVRVIATKNSNKLSMDLQTSGIYFIQLFDGDKQLTNKKLIIQ